MNTVEFTGTYGIMLILGLSIGLNILSVYLEDMLTHLIVINHIFTERKLLNEGTSKTLLWKMTTLKIHFYKLL